MIDSAHTRRKRDTTACAASVYINVVARWFNKTALSNITPVSAALDIIGRYLEMVCANRARKVSSDPVDIATGLVWSTLTKEGKIPTLQAFGTLLNVGSSINVEVGIARDVN